MNKPIALVINGDGINCEQETGHALNLAGFNARFIHTTQLLDSPSSIREAQMLVIPGGFSYGDEIASGKVLAIKLQSTLNDILYDFINDDRLLFGICNGFQVLVQMGFLPYTDRGSPRLVSLTRNIQRRFLNRWVRLNVSKNSPCPFFKGLDQFELPIRHGEGRLILEPTTDPSKHEQVIKAHAVLRYGEEANGSFASIAALTNPKGNVFGLMPHPEAYVRFSQHPSWTSTKYKQENQTTSDAPGLVFFKNARKMFD